MKALEVDNYVEKWLNFIQIRLYLHVLLKFHCTKKLSFPLRISSDLVTFTEELLNRKFHSLCSVCKSGWVANLLADACEMSPHCFDEIQITAEILYYRSPMILSVFGNLLRNEEMKKESQKNPQISIVNLSIKNDFYVYCSNCAYSEISICFFLIYHLESCILMLFFLRTEGNIFSFRMQSSEFFFFKKNAY